MASKELRFGIVGLSMGKRPVKQIAETPGAVLAGVCCLEEEVVQRFASEYACFGTTDFRKLIKRPDIDVIGVWTPSGLHATVAVPALRAGKHVVITKPMDITVKACDRINETARAHERTVLIDFDSHYKPLIRRISQAMAEGRIGPVLHADMVMKWYRKQAYFDGGSPAGWHSRWETEGGSLANQGVHFLELLMRWCGPVARVRGRYGTVAHQIETEDLCNAWFEFTSGAWGTVVTTTTAPNNFATSIQIHSRDGLLHWSKDGLQGYATPELPKGGTEEDLPPDPGHFKNIIEETVAVINDGAQPTCSGEWGREVTAAFCAVYQSARRKGALVQLA